MRILVIDAQGQEVPDNKNGVAVRQYIGSMNKEAFGYFETTFRYEDGELVILKADCLAF